MRFIVIEIVFRDSVVMPVPIQIQLLNRHMQVNYIE